MFFILLSFFGIYGCDNFMTSTEKCSMVQEQFKTKQVFEIPNTSSTAFIAKTTSGDIVYVRFEFNNMSSYVIFDGKLVIND